LKKSKIDRTLSIKNCVKLRIIYYTIYVDVLLPEIKNLNVKKTIKLTQIKPNLTCSRMSNPDRRSSKLWIFMHNKHSAWDKSFSPRNRLVNRFCTFSIKSILYTRRPCNRTLQNWTNTYNQSLTSRAYTLMLLETKVLCSVANKPETMLQNKEVISVANKPAKLKSHKKAVLSQR